ncbi:hypothetical protein SeLEV6574_g04672 [Synchytrium endobioticum]|uniref:Uncharacterized protein n=1 Tax=Synchytrium endobioticum TaxID=286115 RepID=A0A507CYE0_9FUNG|nr:hypothetical protein SeLEV6574_g04672 [Synchytrium endobioticum]
MAKFITISLLAYVAAFLFFTPVYTQTECKNRLAVNVLKRMLLEHVEADNSVSASTIKDALVHINNRIDMIVSDAVPKEIRDSILQGPNNMFPTQLSLARAYHYNVCLDLKALFEYIAQLAHPLKWHFDREKDYRSRVRFSSGMLAPALPHYAWHQVDPQPSRLEQESCNARTNIPASGPVTIFRDCDVTSWMGKIQREQRVLQAARNKLEYPEKIHPNYHHATAKYLSTDKYCQAKLESTTTWGCPYTYADLRLLASENQIWEPLLRAHKELIIARAQTYLKRLKVYRARCSTQNDCDLATTIMEQLKTVISKTKGGDTNTAQTSAVPDRRNVHDVGISSAPGEQTGPVLSYFGGAILEPPTGYTDPACLHDETAFGNPASDHRGSSGANSDRNSRERSPDIGYFIRNYQHPCY